MKRLFLLIFLVAFIALYSKIKIRDVQIFESLSNLSPFSAKKYTDTFYQSKTRKVNFQCNIIDDEANEHQFNIMLKFINKTNSSITEKTYSLRKQNSSTYFLAFGWDEPGIWVPGEYEVQFIYNDVMLKRANFEIIDDLHYPYYPELHFYIKNFYVNNSHIDNILNPIKVQTYNGDGEFKEFIKWTLDLIHPFLNENLNGTFRTTVYEKNHTPVDTLFTRYHVYKTYASSSHQCSFYEKNKKRIKPGDYYMIIEIGVVELFRREFSIK